MFSTESDLSEYKKDPRIPCKYGVKCYQKNSTHHAKYKHPPKNSKRKLNIKDECEKRPKLDDPEVSSPEQTPRKECISDSASDDEVPTPEKIQHPKLFIKQNFLIDMPRDFYQFFNFCKDLKESDPCNALKDAGLTLVGAFDVLAGKFNLKKSPEEYLRHWRYYYDPPELQTVLKGDDSTGYHVGYFFDCPNEPPAFLASNEASRGGVFTKMGDNIFAAVNTYLEEFKKNCDPFRKMKLAKLHSLIKSKAEKLNLNMSAHSDLIKKRKNKVVARTSNKLGLVVPYNKKTQLGYRDLAMSDKDLITLLNKLEKASPEQKSKYLSDLQPVLTYANIALDECDFGTGVKLGWELLCHSIDSLDSTILQFLANSYRYLKKEEFARIAEAHLSNRKKGCDLSIL